MRFILLSILLFANAAFCVTVDDIQLKVNENSSKLKSLRCHINTTITAMGQTVTQSAKIILRFPDRMKMNVSSPQMEMNCICDGKYVYIDMPSLKQQQKKRIENSSEEMEMISMSRGYDDYFTKNNFTLKSQNAGHYLLGAADNGTEGSGEYTEMLVDYDKGVIEEIKIYQNSILSSEITISYDKIGGVWVTKKISMEASAQGSSLKTEMVYSGIYVNETFPDLIFKIPD